MAIAFVTATKLENTTGTSVSGTVTGTAGNAWLGLSTKKSVTTSATTFSGGGTWTVDISGSSGPKIDIASAPNITGGSQTVTVTNTGASSAAVVVVQEFSGLATSSMLDNTPPAITTATNATTQTTGSLSNVTANAVFVACATNASTANPATMTGNTAGWTYNPNTTNETNASSFVNFGTGYLIVSTVASQSSSWTTDRASGHAGISVYKAAAAPALPEGWQTEHCRLVPRESLFVLPRG